MAERTHTTVTPASSRRRFLLAASVGLPVAAVAPALATVAAPARPAELPEILEAGEQIPRLEEAWRAAVQLRVDAAEAWENLRPEVPDELFVTVEDRLVGLGVPLVDINGQLVTGRQIYGSLPIRVHLLAQRISGRTKLGRRLNRLARLAKAYEDGINAAHDRSGYWQRVDAANGAAGRIAEIARDLVERNLQPQTAAGAAIYSELLRAVIVLYEVNDRLLLCAELGDLLARAVLATEAAHG